MNVDKYYNILKVVINLDNEKIYALKAIGCSSDQIKQFIDLYQKGDVNNYKIKLLNHRKELVECIHDSQKRLDTLDYLLYQINK